MKPAAARAPFHRSLFFLAVVLQVLTVFAVIGWRVYLVQTGTTVMLRCTPVDPRSLFNGDYIALGYEIADIPDGLFGDTPRKGQVVYVALARAAGSPYWEAVRVSGRRRTLAERYEVVMRGTVGEGAQSKTAVRFGIESYFVPQREARKIERQLAQAEVQAEVAVGKRGHAALKRLFVDGQEVGCF